MGAVASRKGKILLITLPPLLTTSLILSTDGQTRASLYYTPGLFAGGFISLTCHFHCYRLKQFLCIPMNSNVC